MTDLPLAGVTVVSVEQAVGEHTGQILSTLGYSADQIRELREEGIV